MLNGKNNDNAIQIETYNSGLAARFFRKNAAPLIMLSAVITLILLFMPRFFVPQNLTVLARQISMSGITALGMTFVILTGGIDMSVGSVTAMSGIIFAQIAGMSIDPYAAMALALAAGIAVGIINALGILFCAIPPFIMTIATASIATGLTYTLCKGIPVGISGLKSPVIDFLGIGNINGVPTVFLLFIILAFIFAVILKYLPFGRYVYSVGSSFEGSRLAGVRTTSVCAATYLISGVCAALVGVICVCTYKAGYMTQGGDSALNAIAAIVIGGTSLAGGKGSILGTVIGVALLAAASNIFNLMRINPYEEQIVEGIIIIGAILISTKSLKEKIKRAWRQR